jgi:hypothetical protein
VNNKQLCIPKLGLKHHKLLKDVRSPEATIKIVLDEIDRNMTLSESKIVLFHILEFNGKMKDSFVYKNKTFGINDIYILPRPEFTYNNKLYQFREAKLDEKFVSAKDVLTSLCTRDVDFGEMPAFVYKWAESLNKTIAIDLGDKIVYGNDIEELFNGENT